jgi:hypothetical protein
MSFLYAVAPALPLHAAGKYVAGAYLVFILLILVYVVIMAIRLTRNQKELLELKAELDERDRQREESDRLGSERSQREPESIA